MSCERTMGSNIDRRSWLAGASALCVAMEGAMSEADAAPSVSVTLFDTYACHGHGDQWRAPVHAWIYRPEVSRFRKAAIARLLSARYGLEVNDASRPLFERRVDLLLADNLPGKKVGVVAGNSRTVLPATGANGHARGVLRLGGGSIETMPSGLRTEPTGTVASLTPIGHEGLSIICDIDDTVKQTGVVDPRSLWESTFFKPFTSVPGMAALLRRLGGGELPVHYVSSSPWHLYAPLRKWMTQERLPVASMHLKHIRLKDRTIFDILAGPEKTKPPHIASLLADFPRRRFILVGDSGEKDPEIYAQVLRQSPGRIERILIRRVAGADNSTTRFETTFSGVPARSWMLFDDPAEVRD